MTHDEMRKIYEIGYRLHGHSLWKHEVRGLGIDLMKLSGICTDCNGTGEDGDDGDAAGVGAWLGECQACGGTGFRKETSEDS